MDANTQYIISIVIGIAFLVAAYLYWRHKNKDTTHEKKVINTFEQYDDEMGKYRHGDSDTSLGDMVRSSEEKEAERLANEPKPEPQRKPARKKKKGAQGKDDDDVAEAGSQVSKAVGEAEEAVAPKSQKS